MSNCSPIKLILFASLLIINGLVSADSNNDLKIAVIVHSSNEKDSIERNELLDILSGQQTKWQNGSKILLINRPSISEIYQHLCGLLDNRHSQAKSHECSNVQQNRSNHITKPSDNLASIYVSRFSNSISYISSSHLKQLMNYYNHQSMNNTKQKLPIKVLQIDGIKIEDSAYPLTFSANK